MEGLEPVVKYYIENNKDYNDNDNGDSGYNDDAMMMTTWEVVTMMMMMMMMMMTTTYDTDGNDAGYHVEYDAECEWW